jgi:hypothetical protein
MHPHLRSALIAALAAVTLGGPAAVAGAQGLAAGARDRPWPDGAAALGAPCRADSPAIRIWWSDVPGAPGAVAGADGACATVPPVVAELLGAGEAAAARMRAMGFGALVGEAPPVHLRSGRLAAQLLRARPAVRAAMLRGIRGAYRGSFLAGLTAAQRARVLRGLPRPLARRLAAEVAAARRGTPTGGDRRTDVVVDAAGVTGLVRSGQPGVSPCSMRISRGRASFVESSVVVLAPPAEPAPRASLAHELFHVRQCGMSVGSSASALLKEGTAEWFASEAEPAAFTGGVVTAGGGVSVSGGNARTVTFCNRFDPVAEGLPPYASWGVWQALDGGGAAAAAGVRALLVAASGRTGGAKDGGPATVAAVGGARWSAALAAAVRAQCGALRSPSGATVFAPEVRGFLGGDGRGASPGSPVTLTVPAGGVGSAAVLTAPGAASRISVTAAVPAPVLLGAVAIGGPEGALPAGVAGAAVEAAVPAGIAGRDLSVSVANPSPTAALAVEVRVSTP